jgi:hypothetical protein
MGRRVLFENPFSKELLPRHTVMGLPEYPYGMAEILQKEGIAARLAEIRGQLKLLSDYL